MIHNGTESKKAMRMMVLAMDDEALDVCAQATNLILLESFANKLLVVAKSVMYEIIETLIWPYW